MAIFNSAAARDVRADEFDGDCGFEIRRSVDECWGYYKAGKITRHQMLHIAALAEARLYDNLCYFAEVIAAKKLPSMADLMLV